MDLVNSHYDWRVGWLHFSTAGQFNMDRVTEYCYLERFVSSFHLILSFCLLYMDPIKQDRDIALPELYSRALYNIDVETSNPGKRTATNGRGMTTIFPQSRDDRIFFPWRLLRDAYMYVH